MKYEFSAWVQDDHLYFTRKVLDNQVQALDWAESAEINQTLGFVWETFNAPTKKLTAKIWVENGNTLIIEYFQIMRGHSGKYPVYQVTGPVNGDILSVIIEADLGL
jgi:hypothetical protein